MSSSGPKYNWKDNATINSLKTRLSTISPAELETIRSKTWVESLTALVRTAIKINQIHKDEELQNHALQALENTVSLNASDQLGHVLFGKLRATLRLLRPVFEATIKSQPRKISTQIRNAFVLMEVVDPARLGFAKLPESSSSHPTSGIVSGSNSNGYWNPNDSEANRYGEAKGEKSEEDEREDQSDQSDEGESDEGDDGEEEEARPRTRSQAHGKHLLSTGDGERTGRPNPTKKDKRPVTIFRGAERCETCCFKNLPECCVPYNSQGKRYACGGCRSSRRKCSYARDGPQNCVRAQRVEENSQRDPSPLGTKIKGQCSRTQKADPRNTSDDEAESSKPPVSLSHGSRILSRTRSSIDGEDLSSPQKKKRKIDGPEQSSSDTKMSPQLFRQKTVLSRTVLDPPARLTAPSPLASSSHLNVPTLSKSSPTSPALAVHPVPSTSASTGHQNAPNQTPSTPSSGTALPEQSSKQTLTGGTPDASGPQGRNNAKRLPSASHGVTQTQATTAQSSGIPLAEPRQSSAQTPISVTVIASNSQVKEPAGPLSSSRHGVAQAQTIPTPSSSSTSLAREEASSAKTPASAIVTASSSYREILMEHVSSTQSALDRCRLEYTTAKAALAAAEANHQSWLSAVEEFDRTTGR